MLNNALFSIEEIRNLKNTENEEKKKLISDIIKEADESLAWDNNKFIGFEQNYFITNLGFAYYYTDDEKYLTKARELMLAKVHVNRWFSEEYDENSYAGFDIRTALETSVKCVDMAYGISLFGDKLNQEDRDHLISKTYELGIHPILEDWVLPGKRTNALDTMGHNFWVITISGAGTAAAVLKEYLADADEILEQIIYAVKAWFEYPGNPMNAKPMNIADGGYYESVGYADFAFHEYMKFAVVYNRLMGKHPFDDTEILKSVADFFINVHYPTETKDMFPGFGDSSGEGDTVTPLYMMRYGIVTPETRWYLRTRAYKYRSKLHALLLWDEIFSGDSKIPDNLSKCWDKMGWAIFRDSWDKNKTMLAVKCGDTWNHAHADSTHFILLRNGIPEIYDSLVNGYSHPLYQSYYVTPHAHNVLLFNDKGQDFRDNYKNHAKVPGRLLNYTDDDGFRYVVADGTGPMGRWFRKHHRHFLWIDDFILIYDDVECYECGKVSFLLHAQKNNCFRMLSSHTVEEKKGYKHKDHSERKYLSYNTMTDDEAHAKFCSVMLLDETLEPKFTEIKNGWKIEIGSKTIYINHRADGKVMHRNCINVMDGIFTDAEILVDAGDNRYAVANGSMVRKDGVSYLDVLARITGWADKANRTI